MFMEERRARILELLKNRKRITVSNLSKELKVSEVTIRRDLAELEEQGLLIRTHGGAMLKEGRSFEPSLEDKEIAFQQEKKMIGKKAAEYVREGDTILIDAGTTTVNMVEFLQDRKGLTVVTNAINIANKLIAVNEEARVFLVGGSLKKPTMALVGPLSEKILNGLRVDKAFLGTNGVTLEDGFTTPDPVEARVKTLMVNIAKEVFILADHSKFGQTTFCCFADLNEVDYLITDKVEQEMKKAFQDKLDIIEA